jgi:hypothetical protein
MNESMNEMRSERSGVTDDSPSPLFLSNWLRMQGKRSQNGGKNH